MIDFSNDQIQLADLPKIGDIEYEGLQSSYLTAQLISIAIFWLFAGSGFFTLIFANPWEAPQWVTQLLMTLLGVIIISTFAMTFFGFKKKKYALRSKDIVYQTGLFWRKLTVLPFNRVQHAEVEQDPVERMFKLGKIKIYTAGGSSSDLSISGISYEQAQSIKHFILHQTVTDDEEE